MTRASRTRSSVWKVSDKHPGKYLSVSLCTILFIIISCASVCSGGSLLGYNASDSDSDELKGDS